MNTGIYFPLAVSQLQELKAQSQKLAVLKPLGLHKIVLFGYLIGCLSGFFILN